MRAEKKLISAEYLVRLNSSPFVILVDYRGMAVSHFNELRKRLNKAGAEIHVVKNSLFRIAAQENGLPDIGPGLIGQVAAVTGQKDISSAAKVIKTFRTEFDRPKIHFGFLNKDRLDQAAVLRLADLPSLDVLRAQLLGLVNTPARQLAVVIKAPGQQLSRVLQARVDKGE